MPKIRCLCGEVIGLGEIPCPYEYMFISDEDYDKFDDPIDSVNLYLKMTKLIKCPACGRIYIYWNGFNEEPEVFQKEKLK